MVRDLIATIEAAYRVQLPEEEWLRSLAQSAHELVADHVGVGAMVYDARTPGAFTIGRLVLLDTPHGFDAARFQEGLISVSDPSYYEATFRNLTCATTTETPSWPERQVFTDFLAASGVRDLLGINGLDCSGIGAYLGFFLLKPRRLSPRTRESLSRIAVHLAAAYRLRGQLALAPGSGDIVTGSEAVLEADGKLSHAEGGATTRAARDAIQRGARALERARGRLRREDPEAAIAEWKGLIAARWTLVDHFDSDGRRYLVARKNDPVAPALERLSEREGQVVAHACLGHSSKLIAYELGISVSTVDVLIGRAVRKLGFDSRKSLVTTMIRRGSAGK